MLDPDGSDNRDRPHHRDRLGERADRAAPHPGARVVAAVPPHVELRPAGAAALRGHRLGEGSSRGHPSRCRGRPVPGARAPCRPVLLEPLSTAMARAEPTPPPPATAASDQPTGPMLKRLLLGRPLATARLAHERLGKSTALAMFSSDNMSSVAYATEEILRVLIPAVGIAAFSLVLPISGVIVLIEAILIFSYRQTIKAYPSAGGAYIVTKDNLGLLPAQLAGVALLVDYVLTVSVSTAAGVQAISSVVPISVPFRIVLSLMFVWLIAYGNLLGVRESGRIFAVPTYLFIASLYVTCALGLYRVLGGHLQPFSTAAQEQHGGLTL